MNESKRSGICATTQNRCCFLTRALPMTPRRSVDSSPRMSLSLRKLTLAVALSLTVSSHRAVLAETDIPVPITETAMVAQEQGTLGNTTHKPKAASIAQSFRSRGIPDAVTVMVVSGLPVVELRGGIPLGHYLGLGPIQTLSLAIIGNLAPLIPMMLLLRIRAIRSLASKFLERARKAADGVSNARSRAAALALFVGIPLPGTGAWTGCLVALLLDMPIGVAFTALTVGVVMAGIIVNTLCVLGRVGAAIAGCVLLGSGSVALWRSVKGMEER